MGLICQSLEGLCLAKRLFAAAEFLVWFFFCQGKWDLHPLKPIANSVFVDFSDKNNKHKKVNREKEYRHYFRYFPLRSPTRCCKNDDMGRCRKSDPKKTQTHNTQPHTHAHTQTHTHTHNNYNKISLRQSFWCTTFLRTIRVLSHNLFGAEDNPLALPSAKFPVLNAAGMEYNSKIFLCFLSIFWCRAAALFCELPLLNFSPSFSLE